MKRFELAIMVISVLGWGALIAQSNSPKAMAEFTGAPLKWIHAAEPEFQRRKLDLSKYSTSVIEERDSVTVVLKLIDAVEGAKGSSGSYPEIRGRNQQEESEGTAAQLSSMTMGNANWLAHAKRLDLPERRNRARVVTV